MSNNNQSGFCEYTVGTADGIPGDPILLHEHRFARQLRTGTELAFSHTLAEIGGDPRVSTRRLVTVRAPNNLAADARDDFH
nr:MULTISPECIES: hypothetical protein [unclassified Pseudonocardia]